ncbi:winged helix DNA-binding domain-containing protein [Amycolatopsis alba]|uniref:Winged helix DNA-binding domain-containing protein n=1 Tax=Amycolatopsis alba DSM 44262 TaxID=1125972 RepID=A0A229RG13_AMYAL|nr:winged helix DNA-binding domain-containing protein [Amycolatopsis alba]OXM45580.1 winged helix DNA-binding domain-containing protein [Amycolatopsis alba DSM 44262]
MTTETLSPRALNRATLARQLLLERSGLPAVSAIERLAGLQAQAPDASYVGLWSRLRNFQADDLAKPLAAREVVRSTLMRGTVHLVTAEDGLALWPTIRPVVERGFLGHYSREIAGLDLGEIAEAGRALLAEGPRTRAEIRSALAERWPGVDPTTLAYAVGGLLPLAHATPRGLWRQTGPAAFSLLEDWVGGRITDGISLDDLVRRYLAAFGPATVRDAQVWSGLTKLKEVFERLRPRLRIFTDSAGKELFDLPDAPRPDPETPAPPRFLPEYDNVLLSHADRVRVIPDGRRVPLPPGNGGRRGTLLVDGEFLAIWAIKGATLTIESRKPLRDQDSIAEEGLRLLEFAVPGQDHDVRFGIGG